MIVKMPDSGLKQIEISRVAQYVEPRKCLHNHDSPHYNNDIR